MANELTVQQDKKKQQITLLDQFKGMVNSDKVQGRFLQSLQKHKDVFVASLIDLYQGDAQLQACKPEVVIAEALKAASLQLPINKQLGFGYIVVFNNSVKQSDGSYIKVPTPTFVIGYKGLIQLALRTGQYTCINADLVYDGEIRDTDKLTGTIDLKGERKSDKVVGYFCHIELKGGYKKTLYMTVHDMASYAKRYAPSISQRTTVEELEKLAQNTVPGKQVGWMGNFNDMALKTVTRRVLQHSGFLSVEMLQAISDDMSAPDEQNSDYAEKPRIVLEGNAAYEQIEPVQEQCQGSGSGEVESEVAPY